MELAKNAVENTRAFDFPHRDYSTRSKWWHIGHTVAPLGHSQSSSCSSLGPQHQPSIVPAVSPLWTCQLELDRYLRRIMILLELIHGPRFYADFFGFGEFVPRIFWECQGATDDGIEKSFFEVMVAFAINDH